MNVRREALYRSRQLAREKQSQPVLAWVAGAAVGTLALPGAGTVGGGPLGGGGGATAGAVVGGAPVQGSELMSVLPIAISRTHESYNCDDVGNRTNSHKSSTYGYQPGRFDWLTSTDIATYQFDANGNTVQKTEGSQFWRYTWDYDNRLSAASTGKQKARYKFDALGRRVQRFIVGGKENTKFIHDGRDVLVDDNAGTLTKYLNAPGIDNKLRQTTGSTTNYFLGDHLGSTNALTDALGAITSQTAYDSFGNATNSSFPSRYQYTGREYDSFPGFYYYRARWYDANLGRFASEDPIGLWGGANLYTYAGNRPLVSTDPLGLFPSWNRWRFNVHQRITNRALAGRATPYQRDVMSRENAAFDAATQDSFYAPQHAMRRPGQSAEDAPAEANWFVRQKICEARELAARGLNIYAMQSLAAAVHTLQDSASPSHAGFQVAWANTIPWSIWNGSHYINEQFDPERNSVADRNTQRVWDYFSGQSPMPRDFFQVISM